MAGAAMEGKVTEATEMAEGAQEETAMEAAATEEEATAEAASALDGSTAQESGRVTTQEQRTMHIDRTQCGNSTRPRLHYGARPD